MAHSILKFSDRHLIIRDDDLMDALELLSAQLETAPNDSLSFLPEFLASDMVHVNGGINPKFDVHLNSEQMLSDFQRLIAQAQENVHGSEAKVGLKQADELAAASDNIGDDLIKLGDDLPTRIETVEATRHADLITNSIAFSKVDTVTQKQLQKKFKHAADFGVEGNCNKANAQIFDEAIQRHLNASGTKEIQGTCNPP